MSTPAFQLAQERLNIVKRNVHEVLGVKREQVVRVVESLSRPGEYEITVHRNGRVEFHTWTVPAPEELGLSSPEPEPQLPVAEDIEDVPDEAPVEIFEEKTPESSSEETTSEETASAEETRLAEGENTPPAPEPPAAATPPAPRRRGRPKKS